MADDKDNSSSGVFPIEIEVKKQKNETVTGEHGENSPKHKFRFAPQIDGWNPFWTNQIESPIFNPGSIYTLRRVENLEEHEDDLPIVFEVMKEKDIEVIDEHGPNPTHYKYRLEPSIDGWNSFWTNQIESDIFTQGEKLALTEDSLQSTMSEYEESSDEEGEEPEEVPETEDEWPSTEELVENSTVDEIEDVVQEAVKGDFTGRPAERYDSREEYLKAILNAEASGKERQTAMSAIQDGLDMLGDQ